MSKDFFATHPFRVVVNGRTEGHFSNFHCAGGTALFFAAEWNVDTFVKRGSEVWAHPAVREFLAKHPVSVRGGGNA